MELMESNQHQALGVLAEQELANAERLFSEFKYKKAAKRFEAVLEFSWTNTAILWKLGLALFESQQLVAAASNLERLVGLSPDNVFAQTKLGEIYMLQGEPNKAAAVLTAALANVKGQDSEAKLSARLAHFRLGTVFDQLGQHDSAWGHIQRGNEIVRSTPGEDRAMTSSLLSYMTEATEAFPVTEFTSMPRAPGGGEQLVFIVGLPRTGTTLLEQIFHRHVSSKRPI
jgi:tetratricopeptide (TPR) repeat protein